MPRPVVPDSSSSMLRAVARGGPLGNRAAAGAPRRPTRASRAAGFKLQPGDARPARLLFPCPRPCGRALVRAGFRAEGDADAVPGVDGGDGPGEVGQLLLGEVTA